MTKDRQAPTHLAAQLGFTHPISLVSKRTECQASPSVLERTDGREFADQSLRRGLDVLAQVSQALRVFVGCDADVASEFAERAACCRAVEGDGVEQDDGVSFGMRPVEHSADPLPRIREYHVGGGAAGAVVLQRLES